MACRTTGAAPAPGGAVRKAHREKELLGHYVRKYRAPYLERQGYLKAAETYEEVLSKKPDFRISENDLACLLCEYRNSGKEEAGNSLAWDLTMEGGRWR